MTVIGEYNREGFRVVNAHTGATLFVEGNKPGGGVEIIDNYNQYALPIHTIRSKCTDRTKQIADKTGFKFGGVERVED